MKKCVIISDSFKGTLSTFEIMDLFKSSVKEVFPDCEVLALPIADGGEGTTEAFANVLKGTMHTIKVHDSNFNLIDASYYITDDNTAIIEVASAISLPNTKIKDPFITTTLGVGELIKDAYNNKVNKIILGLGGSSTNDVGCGIAYALGCKFYNKNNEEFLPVGGTLNEVVRIDDSATLKDIEIIGMCDVSNPLYGEKGAAKIYAIQKGATKENVGRLDDNVKSLSDVIIKDLKKDVSAIPGAGAAGGIGGGIIAFLNARLESGVKTLLETINFKELVKGADVIFTGEGKYDAQTLNGKVVEGVKEIANSYDIPVVVIAGGVDEVSENEIHHGIEAIMSTTRLPMAFEDLKPHSKEFYKSCIDNVLRLIRLGEKIK